MYFLDVLFGLLSVCAVLAFGAFTIALPVVALVRSIRVGRRLDRLEAALQRVVPDLRVQAGIPAPRDAIAEPPTRQAAPPVEHRAQQTGGETAPDADHAVSGLEALVGGRALGWVAALLLLVAAAFFLRLVIERGLIGELGRVAIGLAVGLVLCGAGYAFDRRGWRAFSQMLTAAGIAVVYLATFATFGFYHLLSQEHAAPFLVVIVIEALALAVLYASPSIALMAVIGGLLTPVLLRTDQDRYPSLFTYLAVLNSGVVLLVAWRGWWASATVALAGTHGLFWAWHSEHYHPTKLPAVLTFLGVVFGLFLADSAARVLVRGRRAGVEDLLRLVLNAVCFAAAGYVLLDPDYSVWLGTAAVGMSVVYALLTWLVLERRPDDLPLLFVALATSMGFLAAALPVQAGAAWVAIGWAAQGLALWGFGLRVRAPALRGMGAALLALAVGRLVIIDTLVDQPHPERFVPVLNRYGLSGLAVVAALIVAAGLSYRTRPRRLSADFVAMRALSLTGFLLLWAVASVEAYDFFATRANPYDPAARAELTRQEREMEPGEVQARLFERDEQMRRAAQTALSVVWAFYAVGVLLVGFRFHSRPLRWLALGVFALTLGKVVFIDTQALSGFYRVTAYLVLAVVMGGAAWAYQKVKRALSAEPGDPIGRQPS
jgi:uncharacterized membrane protein